MAQHDPTVILPPPGPAGPPPFWTLPVPREAVAESVGTSYWSVDEDQWDTLVPSLPDELVELLAPPVVVGALPCVPAR